MNFGIKDFIKKQYTKELVPDDDPVKREESRELEVKHGFLQTKEKPAVVRNVQSWGGPATMGNESSDGGIPMTSVDTLGSCADSDFKPEMSVMDSAMNVNPLTSGSDVKKLSTREDVGVAYVATEWSNADPTKQLSFKIPDLPEKRQVEHFSENDLMPAGWSPQGAIAAHPLYGGMHSAAGRPSWNQCADFWEADALKKRHFANMCDQLARRCRKAKETAIEHNEMTRVYTDRSKQDLEALKAQLGGRKK